MDIKLIQKKVTDVDCDVLVVGIYEGQEELTEAAAEVDKAIGGAVAAHIKKEKFEGRIGLLTDLTPASGVAASRIVVVGLGKEEDLDQNKIRQASGAALKRAKGLEAVNVAISLPFNSLVTASSAIRAITEGAILGTYQFTMLKTEDVKPNPIEQVEILAEPGEEAVDGLNTGRTVANAVNFARDLINGPANIVTPSYLAEQAEAVAEKMGLECKIIKPEEMKKMEMNLLLSVAKGCSEEPRFILLKYTSPQSKKTIALVGKGITFDAGGLCLKTSGGLENSRVDMSGAAAVIASMMAVAELKPDVNVLGLAPATENLPGGNATRPGDVITGLSGKSVEINNTDAEGRLILADGVAYAENEGADEIIDIATLTGACVGALGKEIAGIMGTSQKMIDSLIQAGEAGGEKLWQLPLHDGYEECMKSDLADIKNSGNTAGAITGGLFIKKHIKNTPWVHIDIAGTCYSDKDTPTCPKGGAGFGVQTLVNYVLANGE